MPKTADRPQVMFEPARPYSTAEVAEILNTTQRQVRRWVYDGRFTVGGAFSLPRGVRIYGWALNEFVSDRTL